MFPFRQPKAIKFIKAQIEDAQSQRAQAAVALSVAETQLVYRKEDVNYYDVLLMRLNAQKDQLEKELNGDRSAKSGHVPSATYTATEPLA